MRFQVVSRTWSCSSSPPAENASHGVAICANPCLECESFPVVPILQPGASRGLRDCIMIYEGDAGFIKTSQAMYDALAAKPAEEDWEAVLLEFPGGGHSSPLQSTDWIIGCLGIVVSCGVECESWFVGSCMDDAAALGAGAASSCSASASRCSSSAFLPFVSSPLALSAACSCLTVGMATRNRHGGGSASEGPPAFRSRWYSIVQWPRE